MLVVEFEVEMVLEMGHKIGDHIIPFGGEEWIEIEWNCCVCQRLVFLKEISYIGFCEIVLVEVFENKLYSVKLVWCGKGMITYNPA